MEGLKLCRCQLLSGVRRRVSGRRKFGLLTVCANTKVDLLWEAVFLVCFSDTENCIRRSFCNVRPYCDLADCGGPRCKRSLSGCLPDSRAQCGEHDELWKAEM